MSGYCSMHGRFEMTTGGTCPQCVGQLFGAAPAPDTEPPSLSDAKRDRMWCLALIPEGSEVVQRVTSRFLALRSTGDAAPTEPSDAAAEAFLYAHHAEAPFSSVGIRAYSLDERITYVKKWLRAAYAVDGVRAAPTQHTERQTMTATATDSPAAEQIARLADFIMQHIPGEPSRSEGAVDTAIRLLRAAPDAARLIAEAEKILAHRAVASPFRESLREAVEQARWPAPDAARLRADVEMERIREARRHVRRIGCDLCMPNCPECERGSSSQEGDG